MIRYILVFALFFINSVSPVLSLMLSGFTLSALVSVIFFSIIYVVSVSRISDLKNAFFKGINLYWIIYGILLVISIVNPMGSSEYQKVISAIVFLFALPVLSILMNDSDIKISFDFIYVALAGILIGSLLVCLSSFVVYDLNEISDRTVVNGSLSPSVLGRSGSLLLISSIMLNARFRYKLFFYGIIVFTLIFLLIVNSKGSLLGLLVAMSILFFYNRKKLLLISLVPLVYIGLTKVNWVYVFHPFGIFNTLYSRISLWSYVYSNLLYEKYYLYFGHGYGSAQELLTKGHWGVNVDIDQCHNMIVESNMNVGLVGTLFLIVFWIKVFFGYANLIKSNSIKESNYHVETKLGLFTMIFFFVRGFTEASIAQAGSSDLFIIALFVIILNFSKRITRA